jgi:hypothetical protein
MGVGTGTEVCITNVDVFDPLSFPTTHTERAGTRTPARHAMLDVLEPAVGCSGIGFLMTDSSELSVDQH